MSYSRDDMKSDMWVNWSKALEWAMEGRPVKFTLANNDEQDVFWQPNQDGSVTITVVTNGIKQDSKTIAGP
jgi:membrane carboxypeptidase/penicillin-binding protein PbpC